MLASLKLIIDSGKFKRPLALPKWGGSYLVHGESLISNYISSIESRHALVSPYLFGKLYNYYNISNNIPYLFNPS